MTLLASLSHEARDELAAFVDARVALALRTRDDGKRWLTANEAGAYLGVSARAVHQRTRRGRIPAPALRHVGRRVLIDRLVLDRSLERGT